MDQKMADQALSGNGLFKVRCLGLVTIADETSDADP